MNRHVELAIEPFDPAERLATFTAALDDEGAVVSFTGRARGRSSNGHSLSALVLETYRDVTLASMESIVAEAHARFSITHSHVVHRAGSILPGEAIVFVVTASTHRRDAFEAADYLMDRLKTEAVFWKREEGPDGDRWIEPTEVDRADTARWATKQD